MVDILYQGLLRSPASWARVGRGYLGALLGMGVDVAALRVRGFRHDSGFALPSGLRELSLLDARAGGPPRTGLGFLHPPLLGRLLGRRRVNLFVWESDVLPRQWTRALHDGADLVVVPSAFTRDALLSAGLPSDRVAVVPYGHDVPNPPGPPARDTEPGPESFTFLSVLAPHRRKGVHELLAAFCRAFRRGDDVLLRIKTTYDPGRSRRRRPFEIPSWHTALTQAGLLDPQAPRVEVDISTVSDAEILELYRRADVCIQPSWGESFGLAHLEAMASGRPLIATDWSGPTDFMPRGPDRIPFRLIEAGDALYQPVAGARAARPDTTALAARMRWHAGHPRASREIGLAAREAVASLSWPSAATGLLRWLG